jgi:hypothetical protein
MTEPIIPITPTNPNIFPVPPVGLPRIDPQEREQRRREREGDESEPRPREERRAPQQPPRQPDPQPRAPQLPAGDDDGHEHVDVTA